MKKLSILFLLIFVSFSANAQTAEELEKEQAPKKAKIAKLNDEVKALQAKIDALPGWRKGAFGKLVGAFLVLITGTRELLQQLLQVILVLQ